MTSLLEAQDRAEKLREERLKAIEQKLNIGMEKIFSDTESSLTERAKILSKSISKETLSLRKQDSLSTRELETQILSNKESLKKQQSEATSEIIEQITIDTEALQKAHTQAITEIQAAHKEQVESLRESLQESNRLQEDIVQQATLKKALSKSIIPLIVIVFILIISSVGLGFYIKIKKDQIAEMQAQAQDLKQQGASLRLSTCDEKLCVEINPKAPLYEGNYRVVVEK